MHVLYIQNPIIIHSMQFSVHLLIMHNHNVCTTCSHMINQVCLIKYSMSLHACHTIILLIHILLYLPIRVRIQLTMTSKGQCGITTEGITSCHVQQEVRIGNPRATATSERTIVFKSITDPAVLSD